MGKQLKLVEKLKKKMQDVLDNVRGGYDKVDLREEMMAGSPLVYATIRGQQRRLDAKLGVDAVAMEPAMAADFQADDFDRFDFGVSDFGVRMVLPAGLITALGILAGDKIKVLEGQYKGRTIKVTEVVDSTTLRFADSVSKSTETDISATAKLSN